MVGDGYNCSGAFEELCRNLLIHLVVFDEEDAYPRSIMDGGGVPSRRGTVLVRSRDAKQVHQSVVEQRLVYRLQQVAFDADLLRLRPDLVPPEGGDHHDFGNILQTLVALDNAAGLQSVQSRHMPIHQYQAIWVSRICGSNFPHRVLPGRNRFSAERKYAKRLGEYLASLLVIVNDQGPDPSQINYQSSLFVLRSNSEPRSEMERTPDPRLTLCPDGTFHHFDQPFRDRESEPGAAIFSRS